MTVRAVTFHEVECDGCHQCVAVSFNTDRYPGWTRRTVKGQQVDLCPQCQKDRA